MKMPTDKMRSVLHCVPCEFRTEGRPVGEQYRSSPRLELKTSKILNVKPSQHEWRPAEGLAKRIKVEPKTKSTWR